MIEVNVNDIKIMAFDAMLERDYWRRMYHELKQQVDQEKKDEKPKE